MTPQEYDLIVIGGGSGGLVCAAGGAGLGAKVALIEKKKLGGDCLNTGCVPSKALIRSAKMIHYFRDAQKYGIKEASIAFDFSDIMDRVKRIQRTLEPNDSPERFRKLGVDVKFGDYHFKSAHELTNGEETITGKKIVISTGSSPFVPPVPGCEESKCVTSDTIWDLRRLPKRFVVVGGGPIGAELAHCFARFGSQVTLIEGAGRILTREDPDVGVFVKEAFERDGIVIKTGATVKRVVHGTPTIVTFDVHGSPESVECDDLLVAVGRRPNIGGLGLDEVGIQTHKMGIVINDYCQTSLSHVYACGDVSGSYQFTHFADYQARVILRNALFPGKSKANTRIVPWCTYTDPELARVGISEEEAKKAGLLFEVTKFPLSDLDRAVCDDAADGLIKVITRKGKDKILGAAIVGAHAGDLISEYALAMKNGLGLKAIGSTIHPYPTLGDLNRKAANQWLAKQLKPWMVKLFQWYFKTILK